MSGWFIEGVAVSAKLMPVQSNSDGMQEMKMAVFGGGAFTLSVLTIIHESWVEG